MRSNMCNKGWQKGLCVPEATSSRQKNTLGHPGGILVVCFYHSLHLIKQYMQTYGKHPGTRVLNMGGIGISVIIRKKKVCITSMIARAKMPPPPPFLDGKDKM